MQSSRRAFAPIVWIVLFASTAHAGDLLDCAPGSFGGPADDPVEIDRDFELPPECTIDFGSRAVIVAAVVRAPGWTVRAAGIEVRAAAVVDGGSGGITLIAARGGGHDGSVVVDGALLAHGAHGGGVVIEAEGLVRIGAGARLDGSASEPQGSGGFVTVLAGGRVSLLARSDVVARAGAQGGSGGVVWVESALDSVVAAGAVEVTGGIGAPGGILLRAGGGLQLQGRLSAAGACAEGECSPAGTVQLISAAEMEVLGAIDARGVDAALYAGATSGGTVTLDCGGELTVRSKVDVSAGDFGTGGVFRAAAAGAYRQLDGSIGATGRTPAASGGAIEIRAGNEVEIRGALAVDGGEDANAGSVTIVAEADIDLAAPITATGNFPARGVELVASSGGISVPATAPIDTSGIGSFGTGGPVTLLAVRALVVEGSILAAGSGENGLGGAIHLDSLDALRVRGAAVLDASGDAAGRLGQGGSVDLRACALTLDAGTSVRANGAAGGVVYLTAGGSLSAAGAVSADDGGYVLVRHADSPPVISGAIEPWPVIWPAASVEMCLEPPAPGPVFVRADCNASGASDISDAIYVLGYLFQGAPTAVPCDKACDMNDDASVDISDAINVLAYLFAGGAAPPPPFGGCGLDPTSDALTCAAFPVCP